MLENLNSFIVPSIFLLQLSSHDLRGHVIFSLCRIQKLSFLSKTVPFRLKFCDFVRHLRYLRSLLTAQTLKLNDLCLQEVACLLVDRDVVIALVEGPIRVTQVVHLEL